MAMSAGLRAPASGLSRSREPLRGAGGPGAEPGSPGTEQDRDLAGQQHLPSVTNRLTLLTATQHGNTEEAQRACAQEGGRERERQTEREREREREGVIDKKILATNVQRMASDRLFKL